MIPWERKEQASKIIEELPKGPEIEDDLIPYYKFVKSCGGNDNKIVVNGYCIFIQCPADPLGPSYFNKETQSCEANCGDFYYQSPDKQKCLQDSCPEGKVL